MHLMRANKHETNIVTKNNAKKIFFLKQNVFKVIQSQVFHSAIRFHCWFSFLLEMCRHQQILDSG